MGEMESLGKRCGLTVTTSFSYSVWKSTKRSLIALLVDGATILYPQSVKFFG
jgi:hypothetical protein